MCRHKEQRGYLLLLDDVQAHCGKPGRLAADLDSQDRCLVGSVAAVAHNGWAANIPHHHCAIPCT